LNDQSLAYLRVSASPMDDTHGTLMYILDDAAGKRRYDNKQAGFGGQTKPVFHKKVLSSKHPPSFALFPRPA